MSNVPRVFRLNLEVGHLDRAVAFYTALLGIDGRVLPGSRVYFTAGEVTLQIVEVVPSTAAPKSLYFALADLDAVFARAGELDCLSSASVHGAPAGEISVRPWSERSFYVDDPWGNPLCFVDETTVYDG